MIKNEGITKTTYIQAKKVFFIRSVRKTQKISSSFLKE